MVSRIYVEKKPGFDVEAQQLAHELRSILGITSLEGLRLVNRYDVEGISQELFDQCVPTVFSEPQVDVASTELPQADGAQVFAVEFLPGQFDQRAASASECIQLISQGERPEVRSAKVYMLEGALSDEDVAAIKHYVINPIEAREASLDVRETLHMEQPVPGMVETVGGFLELDEAGLAAFIADRGLAMDLADIAFCQQYFAEEGRNPTITEIKMIDTYWSDHCRHTTFGTVLDNVVVEDEAVQAAFEKYLEMRHELGRDEKPVCLMDMGTIGARWLKAKGVLTGLDESEEINACTVKCKVDVDGEEQDWLFLFKNETHNHPTEIEPFGGAATCVGGAIRDPLSGRAYVYQAMRVTGSGDPTVPFEKTLHGKLPSRKITTGAAAGYSSYGNQIGLATGQVTELYDPGYVAKRMEIGAVIGASPKANVRREEPVPGDVIVLLGGATGRDGIGGATGSSKAHTEKSVEVCGAEVQKGNAPIERKLQRLFRDPSVSTLIKRCNDFGAGGVSVAIGELADGLHIDSTKCRRSTTVWTAPSWPSPRARSAWPWRCARGRGDVHRLRARGESRGNPRRHGDGGGARAHGVERRRHRGREPRLPQQQRRGEAPGRARAAGWDVRAHLDGRHAGRAHERAGHRLERVLEQGPVRALRLYHRRGHGAHAVRRVASADAGHGHGGEAARVRRDHRGQRHGLGLQPLPHRGEPVHRLVHRRGGERGAPRGRRFLPQGHVPDVPGVLREAARRARALGQARRRRAGRADGAGGPGYRLHRRQGLHVGQFRAAGRAAHAGVVRHGHRLGGSRDVARVQAGGQPRGAHRARVVRRCHARRRRLGGGVRAGGALDRRRCGAGRVHAGIRRDG